MRGLWVQAPRGRAQPETGVVLQACHCAAHALHPASAASLTVRLEGLPTLPAEVSGAGLLRSPGPLAEGTSVRGTLALDGEAFPSRAR